MRRRRKLPRIRRGQRYGMLVVVGFSHWRRRGNKRRAVWSFRCDCGAPPIARDPGNVRSGSVKSCGCLGGRPGGVGHGHSGSKASPEYNTWRCMWSRCTRKTDPSYVRYGARGIRVCDRWKQFPAFLADVGKRPTPDHTLDRIDGRRGYSAKNTRWATKRQQNNNRRDNVRYEHLGESLTLPQWARRTGIALGTLRWRIKAGWSPAKALTAKPRRR